MMPLECSASSSRSIRGLRKNPSIDAWDVSRNRLCMPSVVSAHIVMWVNAPAPEMSSLFWLGSPQRTGFFRCRVSGAR